MTTGNIKYLQVGDTVIRDLCGMEMPLTVSKITETTIECGPWVFDKTYLFEIDEELGWGLIDGEIRTGSFLRIPK